MSYFDIYGRTPKQQPETDDFNVLSMFTNKSETIKQKTRFPTLKPDIKETTPAISTPPQVSTPSFFNTQYKTPQYTPQTQTQTQANFTEYQTPQFTYQTQSSFSLNSNYMMIILVFLAIVGLLYLIYIFRDVIYGSIEEILIYFGIIEGKPIIPEPTPEPVPDKKEKKFCVVGRNENGYVCVPYTNHRDCNSKKYVRESDCVNI
jgi:hypothetical protein